MKDWRLWRGVAVLLALATAGAAIWFSPWREAFDAATLVSWARAHRDVWWAVPAYFALYAIFDIVFIPTQALSVTAVLVWGWALGGLIELAAATAGAFFPYLIARSALGHVIRDRLARHRAVSEVLAGEGMTLLLILRVVPVIPYTLLNYLAGLAAVRPWPYMVATFVGMIPSVFVFAYFVEALIEGAMKPQEVVLRIVGAGLLMASVILATRFATPWVRKRIEWPDHETSPPDGADRD